MSNRSVPGFPLGPAASGVAGPRRWRVREKRHFVALLHQQCWCWGADIKRPAGNLLIAAGLTRQPAPTDAAGRPTGATRYVGRCDDLSLTLWGFGVYATDARTGVMFRRFLAGAWIIDDAAAVERVFTPDALPPPRRPGSPAEQSATAGLASRLATWVGRYERFVDRAAPGHRVATLSAWERATVPAHETAAAWYATSRRFRSDAER